MTATTLVIRQRDTLPPLDELCVSCQQNRWTHLVLFDDDTAFVVCRKCLPTGRPTETIVVADD